MEDLGKRAALTYGFLSLAIWFLKLSMQESGANSIANPAWTLVSGIYTLFIIGRPRVGLSRSHWFDPSAGRAEGARPKAESARTPTRMGGAIQSPRSPV